MSLFYPIHCAFVKQKGMNREFRFVPFCSPFSPVIDYSLIELRNLPGHGFGFLYPLILPIIFPHLKSPHNLCHPYTFSKRGTTYHGLPYKPVLLFVYAKKRKLHFLQQGTRSQIGGKFFSVRYCPGSPGQYLFRFNFRSLSRLARGAPRLRSRARSPSATLSHYRTPL